MQEPRYAASKTNRNAVAIHPRHPGPSTKIWFGSNKAVELLQPVDAPLALMAYWWFSPNSNSRPKIDGQQVRSPGSVIGSHAMNSGIRALLEGESLLETLLLNTFISQVEDELAPAFLRETRSPFISSQMDLLTASGNAVVLKRSGEQEAYSRAVCGGVLQDGMPMTEQQKGILQKQLKDAALSAPDLVRYEDTSTASQTSKARLTNPLTGYGFGENIFDDVQSLFKNRRLRMPNSVGRVLTNSTYAKWDYYDFRYGDDKTMPDFISARRHRTGRLLIDLSSEEKVLFGDFAVLLLEIRRILKIEMKRIFDGGHETGSEGLLFEIEAKLSMNLRSTVEEAAESVKLGIPVSFDLFKTVAQAAISVAEEATLPYQSTSRLPSSAHSLARLKKRTYKLLNERKP